jgi:hypothetical protein
MSLTTVAPPPTFSADVSAFAAERGVTDYLIPVYEMTRRVFPTVRRITPVMEYDPEIEKERRIVFEVVTGPLEESQAVDLRWEWSRELFKICPATHVSHLGLHAEMQPA